MRRLAALLLCAGALAAADLNQKLDDLMQTAPASGFAGLQVVEVSSGNVIYQSNQDRLFLPASNLKILTSAFAWERLKPDYRFTTKILREASGDLALVGSGDPSMSSRVFPYDKANRPAPPLRAIDEMADQVVAHGITSVNGDIVGDDRLFPWEPYPASWTIDDTASDFGAPVSALSLNENTIAISIRPGARTGDASIISLTPALEFLTIDNHVITAAAAVSRNAPLNIHFSALPGSPRIWRITGTIPVGHTERIELLPIDDPALFAATALYDALIRRGVSIRGAPVARHRLPGEAYVPVTGDELASHISPPLDQLLQTMDKVSQNLFAEIFLREAARVAHKDPTAAAAAREMGLYLTQVVKEQGLTAATDDKVAHQDPLTNAWHLEDGSGLSRNALVSPHLMTTVLARMAASSDRDAWLTLFPVGGEDGTLEHRLCCISDGHAIRAKTGSLDRASALSGYADSKSYGRLAFSILANNFSGGAGAVRAWIDKIALALLE